jgi:hypothetical protein
MTSVYYFQDQEIIKWLPPNVEGSSIAVFNSNGLIFGISAKIAGDEGHVSSRKALSFLLTHISNISLPFDFCIHAKAYPTLQCKGRKFAFQ